MAEAHRAVGQSGDNQKTPLVANAVEDDSHGKSGWHTSTHSFGSRGLCEFFQQSPANGALTATCLVSRTIAFSDGRLDNDAAALIARFA
jgi:hypothetical protein